MGDPAKAPPLVGAEWLLGTGPNRIARILLDGSESMKYGSGHLTKFHYAKVMAACLAYVILLQRDAVESLTGIALDAASDTYMMTFYAGRGLKMAPSSVVLDVYADQLRGIFESKTGLRVSL